MNYLNKIQHFTKPQPMSKIIATLVFVLSLTSIGFWLNQEAPLQGRWNVDYVKSNDTSGFLMMSRDRDGDKIADDLVVMFWKDGLFQTGSCATALPDKDKFGCEVMGTPTPVDEWEVWFNARMTEMAEALKKANSLDHAIYP